MDKKSRNILILFGLAFLTIIIVEVTRPKPINWNSSYISSDKIPFGCYIAFEELKTYNGQSEVNLINKNPYDFLSNSSYEENSAYLFINSGINLDKRSYEKLIEFVRSGNKVFLAGTSFGKVFKDSLNIETNTDYQLTEEEIKPNFFSNTFKNRDSVKFKKKIYKTVFQSFDTLKTKALGYYKNDLEPLDQINFIEISEGKGKLYLNTLPEAFSNYYMLTDNAHYTAALISFLETDTFYWDDYIKSGRKVIESPMRFVLNQIPLRWAYYLLILGVLIFILFRGKREQRIIPVIKPLENTSIEFTKTIGDLYFQHKDYSNIIAQKITYFLEKIRSKFYIDTNKLDNDFIHRLAVKSNKSEDETKELIDYINSLRNRTLHNEGDVVELNKKIEEFRL
ncbi:DUF4350 domain-containing protein [uncultured Aquimarina sp.]|uniref:DUF4350 domain-containing protein n=1 Tax=uncultured Aquimarina sp. TaxID=575652 RepID=UPI0026129443|nr:DUF4350 domain-containing protein [uncultured Aquimarina sp.]